MALDIYVVVIVIVSIVILLAMMTHGFHNGAAKELSGIVSLIASLFVLFLLTGIITGLRNGSASNLAIGIIMLILFGIVYRCVHLFVTSINFIAHLPLISWLDHGLGLAAGLFEGFVILYLVEYFLRNYLLA